MYVQLAGQAFTVLICYLTMRIFLYTHYVLFCADSGVFFVSLFVKLKRPIVILADYGA